MPIMEKRPGAAKMTQRMQRIARIIVEGLSLSARAAAWREGMPWEPDGWRARKERTADHQ